MGERLIDRIRAVAEWETAHPEIARAWNEALAEKRGQERRERLAAFLAEQEQRSPDFLRSCGLLDREIDVVLARTPLLRTKAMEAVGKFLAAWEKPAERKIFLLLSGDVGCGKTVAAASYFLTAGRTRYTHPDLGDVWEWYFGSCRYCLAPELAVRPIYGEKERLEETRLKSARALILDELGAEVLSEFWASRLEGIIDARYRLKLPTLLCTNLDRTNFSTRYGARIWRRVREDGMSPSLEVAKEDRRVAG